MQTELKQILLKAKKQVFSNLSGESLSRLKGDGIDLRDIKQYEWGDDVRRINWKATAKSNQILVNTYDEYKQLDIVLVYLVDASMNFGSTRLKQDVVAEVFAYLLYSGFKNKDRVESIFFSDRVLKDYHDVKNINQVDEIVKDIYEFDTLGKSLNYENLLEELNKRYKKGKIFIMIGDFLTKPNFKMLNQKHQSYAIMIRDELEESLSFDGEMAFRDTKTLQTKNFVIDSTVKNEYQKLLSSHDRELKELFLNHQIQSKKIKTDDEVYLKLMELFR